METASLRVLSRTARHLLGAGQHHKAASLGLALLTTGALVTVPGAAPGLAAPGLAAPGLAAPGPATPACESGHSLNVAAHQDDDILFMTPDLEQDIDRKKCLLTVFVTAGDAGEGPRYWREREHGPHAAYAFMAGVTDEWTRSTITVAGRRLSYDTLVDRPEISLLFLRLPDGGGGGGFPATGNESLERLWTGKQSRIHTVDDHGSYSKAELIETMTAIMDRYQPNVIRTLDSVGSYGDHDHGDHHTSAYVAVAAQRRYTTPHRTTGYMAYAIADRPANVRYGDRNHKLDTFMAYAPHDSRVCQTLKDCLASGYGVRSFRQYTTGSLVGGGNNAARVARITSSSQNVKTNQQAGKAVDGNAPGAPASDSGEWATVRGRAGSWINAAWATPQTLTSVALYDRRNAQDGITGGTLKFSDGSSIAVGPLPENGSAKVVTFAPKRVTGMRFTVTAVSPTTRSTGLAEIEAYTANVAPVAAVTASSQNAKSNQRATKAVDGHTAGPAREWVTAGGRGGSWLRLTWRTPQPVSRVVLHDRPNGSDQVTGGKLVFDDGSSVAVPALPNNGAARVVTFPRRTVKSLTVRVTSVSRTTRNVGLAELQVEPNR